MKRKLGIVRNKMFALTDDEGNITAIMNKIVEVAEEFCRDFDSSRHNLDDNGKESARQGSEIPPVTKKEVKKALEAVKRAKQLMRTK